MADEDTGRLTPKQEAFALAYVETGNAAEAYRRAYDKETTTKDSWVYVEACQMLDNPKISLRLAELQDQAAKLSLFTVKQAFDEYEDARQLAKKVLNPSAAVAAISGKVKLFGLEAPTRTKAELSGPNGGPIQTQDVSVEALLDEARRLGIPLDLLGIAGSAQEEN